MDREIMSQYFNQSRLDAAALQGLIG
jgi:hypothetical protein